MVQFNKIFYKKTLGNRFEEITFEVFDHAKRSDHLRVGEVKTT